MRATVARLGRMIAVVALTVSLAFVIVIALPADPARTLVGPRASPATIARIRAHYCLDRSVPQQYACFVGRLARGDLGTSLRSRRSVASLIADRAAATAELAAAALVAMVALTVPLAVWAARRRSAVIDVGIGVALAVPAFVLGPLLLYAVGFRLGWLPLGGSGGGGIDRVRHLILPALTLALTVTPGSVLVLRDRLASELTADHVRAARARGASERRVAWRHALRPALPAWLALLGVDLGALFGGAVIVEAVFAWPGLGRECLLAARALDLPVLLGVTLVAACAVSVASALVDAATWWLDPRRRAAPGR